MFIVPNPASLKIRELDHAACHIGQNLGKRSLVLSKVLISILVYYELVALPGKFPEFNIVRDHVGLRPAKIAQ